jgi:hypothetical protein
VRNRGTLRAILPTLRFAAMRAKGSEEANDG